MGLRQIVAISGFIVANGPDVEVVGCGPLNEPGLIRIAAIGGPIGTEGPGVEVSGRRQRLVEMGCADSPVE